MSKPVPERKWGRFRNPGNLKVMGPGALLRWAISRPRFSWPTIEIEPTVIEPERVARGDLAVTWVGQSSMLIQVDGHNILTDPIWSQRLSTFGPKRMCRPGIRFDDLPPIDVVLLSHDHPDHCDTRTIRRVWNAHKPLFVVPLGMARLMRRMGVRQVTELTWWDWTEWDDLRLVCVPARHWSGRSAGDYFLRLWCGWVVQTRDSGEIYFAGDTGWWDHGFASIRDEFTDIRLAAIPIGAYSPRWFMQDHHIDPAQAVALFEMVGAAEALALHHSTFKLSDETLNEPIELLRTALDERGIERDRFRTPRQGITWRLQGNR